MDEITMFAELRPEAPAQAGQPREAARARLAAEIRAEDSRQRAGTPGLPGPRRVTGLREWPGRFALGGLLTGEGTGRRWRVAATVGAAAAVAAGTTMAVVLPGGGTARPAQTSAPARPGSIVTADWTVRRESGGNVTITFKEWLVANPAALQRALRAEGVPAIVLAIPEDSLIADGHTVHYQGCSYPNLDTAPATVQNAVVRQYLPGGSKLAGEWLISPSAMPPGSTLFVETGYEANPPQVLERGGQPVCVPANPASVRHDYLKARQEKLKAAKQK